MALFDGFKHIGGASVEFHDMPPHGVIGLENGRNVNRSCTDGHH
jgi:hypothetical protein